MAHSSFCPHLTFRLSFRYDSQQQNGPFGGISALSSSSEKETKRNNIPVFSKENQGSGDDRIILESPSQTKYETDETGDTPTPMTIDDDEVMTCDMCADFPVSNGAQTFQQSQPQQLWQCLDPGCGMVLCGQSSKNHSQYHFEDFPSHVLQENLSSKRIWCNECNHEVLPYFGNRRPCPAVWIPPDGSDDDSPRGLYNIGNTCFMNAALQCMLAVTPLNAYFMGYCCSLAGRQVGSSYLWLLTEMWSDQQQGSYQKGVQKGVMPSRLLHSVRSAHPIFRGYHQHDTQEFLRLFMDTLTEETRVPHFVVEPEKKPEKDVSDEGSTSDSETDSFETCDSGNGSESGINGSLPSFHNSDNNNFKLVPEPSGVEKMDQSKPIKVEMRSIVSDIFDGKVESSVQCLSCKQTSRRLEVFQDLSLPIPTKDEMLALKSSEKYDDEEDRQSSWISWMWDWVKSFFIGPTPSLEDCFAAFFSSDELKGKNMYSCEKCKKLRNGVKRCSLYQLPEVLCIHLKRFRLFEYGGGIGFSGKVNQYVQFPLEGLELKPFLHPDCPNKVTSYRLLGTICHMGSFTGGHYIAYVRRGEQWYICDDSRVSPVSPETVAESEAYVLFYQKWDEHEDTTKSNMLHEWGSRENIEKGAHKDEQYHLISRKWLTNFCWGDESGPIDNSDVVCPHGYFAPYDTVHLGATWIPHPVWEIIHNRFGGGPDLKYQSECAICTAAWKKHQKLVQKRKSTPEPSISLPNSSISHSIFNTSSTENSPSNTSGSFLSHEESKLRSKSDNRYDE